MSVYVPKVIVLTTNKLACVVPYSTMTLAETQKILEYNFHKEDEGELCAMSTNNKKTERSEVRQNTLEEEVSKI